MALPHVSLYLHPRTHMTWSKAELLATGDIVQSCGQSYQCVSGSAPAQESAGARVLTREDFDRGYRAFWYHRYKLDRGDPSLPASSQSLWEHLTSAQKASKP